MDARDSESKWFTVSKTVHVESGAQRSPSAAFASLDIVSNPF